MVLLVSVFCTQRSPFNASLASVILSGSATEQCTNPGMAHFCVFFLCMCVLILGTLAFNIRQRKIAHLSNSMNVFSLMCVEQLSAAAADVCMN